MNDLREKPKDDPAPVKNIEKILSINRLTVTDDISNKFDNKNVGFAHFS